VAPVPAHMTSRFVAYELRTTEPGLAVTALPERARAAGAPAHWLGHVTVPDLDATVAAIVTRGGARLGPTLQGTDGATHAPMRDPFGAVFAVTTGSAVDAGARVVWHLHASLDERLSWAAYSAWFGWSGLEAVDLGAPAGRHQVFAWDGSRVPAGSTTDLARQPGIHPQWLFFFAVPDLETAVARVGALGGLALATTRTVRGDLVATSQDPQGGAFGLCERSVG